MTRKQRIRIFAYCVSAILAAAFSGILLTNGASLFSTSASAQDQLWQELPSGALSAKQQSSGQFWSEPRQYRAFQLNEAALASLLAGAPVEFTEAAKASQKEIPLPMPDGSFARFRFVESPIMSPELAAKYPEFNTYRGWSIDDPSVTMRFARTSLGFSAIILSPKGAVYIAPLFRGDTQSHASYFVHDAGGQVPACLVGSDLSAPGRPERGAIRQSERPTTAVANGATLRTYRLAVGTTAEFTGFFPSVNAAIMSIGTTVNNVAAIYQRDLAVSFMLVATVVSGSNPDGYTSGNTSLLIDENQTKLDQTVMENNYDIGHVFDASSAGGRGAVGVVCNNGDKGRGASASLNPTGANFDLLVAHEFGHQFGAQHNFNGTLSNCNNNNRYDDTAYEPGSGSTIMAYPGLCGSDNIQSFKDPYFHGMSLAAMADYINNCGGCATTSSNNNTPPSVTPPFPTLGYYIIPARTPFALTASATDAEDANLTYCWEEADHGSPGPPTNDRVDNPLFRSWLPTTNPARMFPQLSDVLSGVATKGETLPTTNRLMTFIVTVRDNHPSGGGFDQEAVQLNVDAYSGPFVVTQPAAGARALEGRVFTATWDVAGTNLRPVNTANVRILLSTDNGATFPVTLAASTQNDGSFTFIVPRANTTTARIKVEAIDNVFFNISPAFTIIPAPTITTTGGVTITMGGPTVTSPVASVADELDRPESLMVEITTNPLPAGVALEIFNNFGIISAKATAQCIAYGGAHPIRLQVTNSAGLTASTEFNLVVDPNLDPTLGSYANASVAGGMTIAVTPSAQPADANNNLSSVTVSPSTLPGGGSLIINQTTGVVTAFTTRDTQLVISQIRVTASDSCGRQAVRTFFLSVVNAPPQITSLNTPVVTTRGGTSLTTANIATVSDLHDRPGDLAVSATAPPGISVSVTNSNGTVRATAAATCAINPGVYVGTLTVTDTSMATATAQFSINVAPNPPPTMGNYLDTGVTVGGTVPIRPNVAPSDPNNSFTLSVVPINLPGGGSITVNQANGEVTVVTMNTTQLNVYPLTVTATDACNETTTRAFNLRVRSATCQTERDLVYVADTGNHRIQRFNGVSWVNIGGPGNGPGQFNMPESVVQGLSYNRIYVADTGNGRIQWSENGGVSWNNFAIQLQPRGLVVDRDGNLYVSDGNDGRVLRYPGGVPGNPIVLANSGSGAGQVQNPNGLAIDCRMNLYIADTGNNRILRIATADAVVIPNTGVTIAASGAGLNPAQVTAPEGVAVDNAGVLYVADTGNDRILQITSAPASGPGTVVCSFGAALGQVRGPEGVTIAGLPSGVLGGGPSIIISDSKNNRIEGRPLSATVWGLLAGPGTGNGQFTLPSKIR
jgi:hypothetical protein